MDETDNNEVQSQYIDTIKEKGKKRPKKGFSRKAVYDILDKRGFTEDIINIIIDEYARVTNNKNYQDKQRLGILFACICKIYKDMGILFDLRSIGAKMGIDQLTMSRGIKKYCDHIKVLGEYIESMEYGIQEYVRLLLTQLTEIPTEWCTRGYEKIERINDQIDIDYICNSISSIFSYLSDLRISSSTTKSTPRCVAAAIIHFYFVARGCIIDKDRYAKLCGCAPVSIDKHHNDIAYHLKNLLVSHSN